MSFEIKRYRMEVQDLLFSGLGVKPYVDDEGKWVQFLDVQPLVGQLADAEMEIARLEQRIEQLDVQLAGCSTAAMGWIKDPAKMGDYGWSVAYQDVLELRQKIADLEATAKKFKTLCEAVDGGDDKCLPECDEYFHAEKCPVCDSAYLIINLQNHIKELEAELAPLVVREIALEAENQRIKAQVVKLIRENSLLEEQLAHFKDCYAELASLYDKAQLEGK